MHDLRCLAWQTVPLDVRHRNSRCHLRTRSWRFQSLLNSQRFQFLYRFLRPLGRVFQSMVEEFAAQLENSKNPESTHPSMGVQVDVGFIQEMRAVEQWIDCLTIRERLESIDFLLEHGRDPETYFFTCLLHVDGDQRRVEVAAQLLIAQQLAHACTPPANEL
ncbi:hypothetical protein B0H14DRAFT_2774221 [Mycena olivaceomarginata]|nr:hypothetical protein B0H14DRAFT_2774221 [Mycena olivaceomarginata]